MAQEAARCIDDVSVAIEHTRQCLAIAHGGSYEFQRLGRRKHIAGIQEQHVVARGQTNALVHGVVETAVGLTHHHQFVVGLAFFRLMFVGAHQLHRGIARGTVDDEVLHAMIGLREHAVEGPSHLACRIIRAGNNRKLDHRLQRFEAIAS